MAEHIAYARSVKSVDQKHIMTLIATVDVAANDLLDNVARLQAEGLSLEKESNSWVISKGIGVNLSKSVPGFTANTPALETIKMGAEVIIGMSDPLRKMITGYNQKIWSGEAMTVRQVYLLSTIEQMEFWVRYANKLLDALLSMSSNVNFSIDKYLTKNEMLFINGSSQYFSNVTISLLKGKTALLKEISNIPDMDADDETSAEILTGMGNIKPELTRGFGIHLLNPKFWYDSLMKEIDLHRIRSMQEDNEYLAMKINQAVNQKNGSNDAALDHRIEVYRQKIIKNSTKINDIVEDYKREPV